MLANQLHARIPFRKITSQCEHCVPHTKTVNLSNSKNINYQDNFSELYIVCTNHSFPNLKHIFDPPTHSDRTFCLVFHYHGTIKQHTHTKAVVLYKWIEYSLTDFLMRSAIVCDNSPNKTWTYFIAFNKRCQVGLCTLYTHDYQYLVASWQHRRHSNILCPSFSAHFVFVFFLIVECWCRIVTEKKSFSLIMMDGQKPALPIHSSFPLKTVFCILDLSCNNNVPAIIDFVKAAINPDKSSSSWNMFHLLWNIWMVSIKLFGFIHSADMAVTTSYLLM